MAGAGFAGFVLVGGQSRRMGQDKALLDWGGTRLAQRLAERVFAAAGSATLIGSRQKYGHLGWPLLEDLVPGRGPLSGIHTALKHTPARWNLVVGCDLPFLTTEFLAFLLGIAEAGDSQAVVPVSPRFGYEPLAAVYRQDCLGEAEAALEGQQYKIAGVLDRLRLRTVLPDQWRPFDPEGILFENVNTPQELERARQRAGG